MNIKYFAMFALAFVLGLGNSAQAQQKTLTVSGSTPAGALAMMTGMSRVAASAGAQGFNALANAQVQTFKSSAFNLKSAFAGAQADLGMVTTNVTTRLGAASSGANGLGVNSWSSGVSLKSGGNTQKDLSAGASATNGGAWATVTTPNWQAVTVGVGENVQVQTNLNVSPVDFGGGKG